MNEHIRIRRVVEGLRSQLKSNDFGDEFRSLIGNYNNCCRQLKQRLEQVDAILLSGNVSGALKMAETDPSVLDLLTLLGFAESQDLKDWCVVNGVSFEGTFDEAVIHRLNEAYSSNRETDTQLEKEYRKAILKKDYASALPIARTVARLQPHDNAAQTELKNIERRYAKQLESRLDAALHSKDIDNVQVSLLEFDNLRCEDYSGGEVVRQARQLVQEKNDQDGIDQIKILLENAPEAPDISDWLEFEALYDNILGIKDSLSVGMPADLEVKWVAFSELEKNLRERFTRANSQRIAFEKLKSVVNHAQTARITEKQTGLSLVQSSLETLLSTARSAESLAVEIDSDLQARWQEEVLYLRGRVSLMLKALRRKRLAVSAISLVFLIAIGLTAYFYARSSKIISQADTILANQDLSGARAFSNANYPEEWLLGLSQAVKARNEKVRQFIATDEGDAAILVDKLKSFEDTKGEWSSDIRSMVFADVALKTLFVGVEELSHESARPIRLELDRLENELAVIRNAVAGDLVKAAESKLNEMEKEILPQLSLSNPPDELFSGIEVATKAIGELNAIDARGESVVTITEDQRLRQNAFIEAREKARAAVEAHNDFMGELTNAVSIEAYNEILLRGLKVDYIGSPFYRNLVDLPTSFDEGAFRQAAFTELPKVFSDIVGGDTLAPLSPSSALLPKEVDAYKEFRFNKMVEGIEFHEVIVPNPVRTVRMYSMGEVAIGRRASTGGYIKTDVSGRLYVPHMEKGMIRFVDYERTPMTGLTSYGDIPELELLKSLGVDDLLSSQREVVSNASNPAPFLRLIDKIRADSAASDDYKCFAVVQLFNMMEASGRPEQWGLSYLPKWQDEVQSLKDLGIKNGDWMKDPFSRQLVVAKSALSEFFDGASLDDLARVHLMLVNEILQTKVKYHGYIAIDEGDPFSLYGGFQAYARSRTSGQWIQIKEDVAVAYYMPLSPVLSISPSLSQIYNQVCEDMGVDAYTAAQMANSLGIKLD